MMFGIEFWVLWVCALLATAQAVSPRGWQASKAAEQIATPAVPFLGNGVGSESAQAACALPPDEPSGTWAAIIVAAFLAGLLVGLLWRRRSLQQPSRISEPWTPSSKVVAATAAAAGPKAPEQRGESAAASDIDLLEDTKHHAEAATSACEGNRDATSRPEAGAASPPPPPSPCASALALALASPETRPEPVTPERPRSAVRSVRSSEHAFELEEAGALVATLMTSLQVNPAQLGTSERLQLAQIVLQAWNTQQGKRHSESVER